jgi:hypothetical protein
MIIEYILVGFFSAIGWWGANHYVIDPYFPAETEQHTTTANSIK